MSGYEEKKIQKFNGKYSDDYNLWRLRAEVALKGKGYWTKLEDMKTCDEETKSKASALIVSALGDTALRVCSSRIGDPLNMLKMLDNRCASSRTATRISVLTTMYTKRFDHNNDSMANYVDVFEALFSQLEKMGDDTNVPESHKAPLLLSSLGNNSPQESTIAALRTKDVQQLSWEQVTADLIQEWNQKFKTCQKNDKSDKKQARKRNNFNRFETHKSLASKNSNKSSIVCDYCGKKGHKAEDCFVNPNSKSVNSLRPQ